LANGSNTYGQLGNTAATGEILQKVTDEIKFE
jgi:hypothetical protein